MASPDFTINGGAVGVKASVGAGTTVTCLLDSTDGVDTVTWSIIRTDDTTTSTQWDTTFSISGSVGQQVQFTALTAGTACIVQAQINAGKVAGLISSESRATAKVFVPDPHGLEVLTADELVNTALESSATHGAVVPINAIIRSGVSGDVWGPAGATDNAIARYDLGTGKLLQDSTVFITDAGAVGINTPVVPHGGLGSASLALDGADSSAAGPHIQLTTDGDNYSVMSFTAWTHDAAYLGFDCYYHGNFKSSDGGSNYLIAKETDKLLFYYDSGVAQGASVTWNVGLSLDTAGVVNTPTALSVGTTTAVAGHVRLPNTGSVLARNSTDTADISGFHVTSNNAWVGGTAGGGSRPSTCVLDGGLHQHLIAGVIRLQLSAAYAYFSVANLAFTSTTISPVINQLVDTGAGAVGDTLETRAQDVNDGAGGATAGNRLDRGGRGLGGAGNTDGNIALHELPASFQSMEEGLFISDAVTAPTGNPAAGGFLYSVAGAGTWRGSGGTITAFGPAGPRCSECGHDHWRHASVNQRFGSYLLECGMCGKVYKKGPASVLSQLEQHELDELVYDDDDPEDNRPAHKKRSIIATVSGPARRNKRVAPTLQEYRRQWQETISSAAVVDEREVEYDTGKVDDDGKPVMATKILRVVDQQASRAKATAALAALRDSWVDAWQSWRDLYGDGRDSGDDLVAALDADIATANAEADTQLAEHEWPLPPEDAS